MSRGPLRAYRSVAARAGRPAPREVNRRGVVTFYETPSVSMVVWLILLIVVLVLVVVVPWRGVHVLPFVLAFTVWVGVHLQWIRVRADGVDIVRQPGRRRRLSWAEVRRVDVEQDEDESRLVLHLRDGGTLGNAMYMDAGKDPGQAAALERVRALIEQRLADHQG